jgi:hypothetical protein
MISISPGGLLGATVGTIVAAVNYFLIIGFIQASLRKHDTSQTAEERAAFESKLATMRRVVLTLDVLVFGGVGYWLGDSIANVFGG